MKYLGKHYLLELYNCPSDILSDPKIIGEKMKKAAEAMKANIVESTFHHFNPLGVSGVVIIKESHLTIHTWPEYGYAAVDVFTCGKISIDNGVNYLRKALKAEKVEIKRLGRGASEKFKNIKGKEHLFQKIED